MSLFAPTQFDVTMARQRRERLARLGCLATSKPKEKPKPPPVRDFLDVATPYPASALSAPEPLNPKVPEHTIKTMPEHTIKTIQKTVAAYFGLKLPTLLSPRRTMEIVRPRQIAMYLCVQLYKHSLPEIGRRFGGKDHTTVLHARNRIKALIEADPEFAEEIAKLANNIHEALTGGTYEPEATAIQHAG